MTTLCNTVDKYGWLSKAFHWVIAILVICMLVIGVSFDFMTEATRHYWVPIHKSIGLTILILMVPRLIWKWINPHPKLPSHVKLWEKIIANSVHWLIYFAIFIILCSGWVMSAAGGHVTYFWGLFNATLPMQKNLGLEHVLENVHQITAYTLIGLLTAHILAALKHHFINKDNILKRMLPFMLTDPRNFQ